MKMNEIRNMETADLQERLTDLKKKYANLKVRHHVTPVQNPMELRMMRRTIARMMTELNQRGN